MTAFMIFTFSIWIYRVWKQQGSMWWEYYMAKQVKERINLPQKCKTLIQVLVNDLFLRAKTTV